MSYKIVVDSCCELPEEYKKDSRFQIVPLGIQVGDWHIQDDAEAIALATLNMLDKLPDACPNDAYWSLGQLVHRRDNIMKQRTRLVNQLHEQL